MPITCKNCGTSSASDAERCDCGHALEDEQLDAEWIEAALSRTRQRRRPLFVLSGTLLGGLLGVGSAMVVLRLRAQPSPPLGVGVSDLPPAVEVPLGLAVDLGGLAFAAAGALFAMAIGALLGALLGAAGGLALSKR